MRLIATLLLITVLIVLLSHYTFSSIPSFFYQTIALVFLGTAGLYFYLLDVKKHRPEYFIQVYMATLFAKILAYGAYILFVVWDDPIQARQNALIFMVTYFIFTAIEIGFLYRKFNR